MTAQLALFVVLAFLVSIAAVAVVRRFAEPLGFIDVPNRRSSHARPTPRGGGLGIVMAIVVAMGAASSQSLSLPPGTFQLLAGGVLVALVGLADDRWRLPAGVRFSVYLVASAIPVVGGSYLRELQWPAGPSIWLGILGAPLTVLWLVAVTNIYNFMDGVDGIAGTQAVVAAGAVGAIAILAGDSGAALFALVLAAAVMGFLFHNWPPARIFMGDSGSAFLGFTLAGLVVLGGGHAVVSFALLAILLAPFLFDATFTLIARASRGERLYEAHRQHLYQRLVRREWSHLKVTCVYLAADLYLAALALVSALLGLGGLPLAILAILPLGGILALVRRVEATRPEIVQSSGPTS